MALIPTKPWFSLKRLYFLKNLISLFQEMQGYLSSSLHHNATGLHQASCHMCPIDGRCVRDENQCYPGDCSENLGKC